MKKSIVFIVLLIVAGLLAGSRNPVATAIFCTTVVTAMYTIFFEDSSNEIKNWLSIPTKSSELTIFLYGRGGSGKTTFIKSLLSLESLKDRHQSSTEHTTYYKGTFHCPPFPSSKFQRKYTVPIQIADYKGQDPGGALNLRRNFMSQVNAIIFVVDIVHPNPRLNGSVLSNAELIEWLSTDTEKKIDSRVTEHISYIGDAILSVIFGNILSVNRNRLRSVRLVINKVDIIQKLMSRGYLPNAVASGLSSEDYVYKKFEPIENYVRNACTQNGILDVSLNIVSFAEGTGERDLIQGLLKTHLTALRIL